MAGILAWHPRDDGGGLQAKPTTHNCKQSIQLVLLSGFARHPSPQYLKNLTNHLQIPKISTRKMAGDPRMSAQEVCRHISIIHETVLFLELTELPVS